MIDCLPSGAIHVKDLRIWSHVGVLEQERQLGQWFSIDFSLWLDLDKASKADDLAETADYSLAIRSLQHLASEIRCFTLEHFNERILDVLEELYGQVKMRVVVQKCNVPLSGFTGTVSVERYRYSTPT